MWQRYSIWSLLEIKSADAFWYRIKLQDMHHKYLWKNQIDILKPLLERSRRNYARENTISHPKGSCWGNTSVEKSQKLHFCTARLQSNAWHQKTANLTPIALFSRVSFSELPKELWAELKPPLLRTGTPRNTWTTICLPQAGSRRNLAWEMKWGTRKQL